MGIRATINEVFDFVIATAPSITGAAVDIEALYGLDGQPAGSDESAVPLALPVLLQETSPGVYTTKLLFAQSGVYWARVRVNGSHSATVLVRIFQSAEQSTDAVVAVPYTVGAVAPSSPASLTLSLRYPDGSSAGHDVDNVAFVWPQPMLQVPGYGDSFYFEDVVFSEGGRVTVALTPPVGPSMNSVLSVYRSPQAVSYTHFDGFVPDAAYDPSEWISLSYIRKWAGWPQAHISDEDLRELRLAAIETFINETNCFVAGWTGTWHALRAQGDRLYLPMPIVLPSAGGVAPVVEYCRREGAQERVETISSTGLAWRVAGFNAKQPYLELVNSLWDHGLDIRIYATWGLFPANQATIKAKQVLVGLTRWHSLSFGVDADDARAQSTLNRISSESNRDVSVSYDQTAIGRGVTGDRTVDRALAEFTVHPGPWIRRGGTLPVGTYDRGWSS